MFWFVSAVVLLMIAIIDLATNLHVLVLRRLARRRAERRSSEVVLHYPGAIVIDPDLDLDTETILKALHAAPTAPAA
jgi:hypothetical protein